MDKFTVLHIQTLFEDSFTQWDIKDISTGKVDWF